MYYIIELQTNKGSTSHLVTTESDLNAAKSKYHTVLAAAAISSIEHHACIIADEHGRYIAQECFDHEVEQDA